MDLSSAGFHLSDLAEFWCENDTSQTFPLLYYCTAPLPLTIRGFRRRFPFALKPTNLSRLQEGLGKAFVVRLGVAVLVLF